MENGKYFVRSIDHLNNLENSLGTVSTNEQRIGIYNRIISGYIFCDLDKAGNLIEDLGRQIAEFTPFDKWNYLYNRAWYENQRYHYSLSSELFSNLLGQIHVINEDSLKAELYLDFAGISINTNSLNLAIELLDKSIKIIEQLDLQRHKARYYIRKAYISLQKGKYLSALDDLFVAENIFTSEKNSLVLKDYYFLQLLYSGYGHIYEQNNEIERSIKAYKKALSISKKNGVAAKLSWFYLNVGKGQMAVSNYSDAIISFKNGISHVGENFDKSKASIFANLGFCYFKLENYEIALNYFNQANIIYEDFGINDSIDIAVLNRWKGMLFCQIEEFDKAEKFLAKAFEISDFNNDNKQLANVCKEVSSFYSHIGDYENAYEYMLLNSELTESYLAEINERKVSELEIRYEVQKQKEASKILKLESINLQLKALRAQMNPHFMYNALNSIQSFITSDRKKEATKYLAKFASLMRQSLEYSNVESISIEKEVKFLSDYLFINQKLRFEENNINYTIEVDDEIDDEIGIPTMIVQPYVENAIEHGLRSIKNGHIHLSFELLDDDSIICIVEDNGAGRVKIKELQKHDQKYKEHKSRGTSITEERLRLLHKKYEKDQMFVTTIDLYDEETGKATGTRVEIVLPSQIITYT